jgi:hypothetical protein
LEYLLEEHEYESVIGVRNEGESQALIGTEICFSFQVSDVLEEKVDEYVVRNMTNNLLLESKIEDKKQQMSCAEGDVSKDIKDVWENEERNQQLEDESIELRQGENLRQSNNVEIEEVKSESFESNKIKPVVKEWERQFYVLNVFQEVYSDTEDYKRVYIPVSESKVQWQSNENKDYLQQETELQDEIDELWDLMQFSKGSYSRVKQTVQCEAELKVKNDEEKISGALQPKV